MTKKTWPLYEGKPMHHVITVGRAAIVPALPKTVAAVAVFVNSIGDNSAATPDTNESKVLFLSAKDLARGTTPAAQVFGGDVNDYAPAEAGSVLISETSYEFEKVRDPAVHDADKPESELDEEQISLAMDAYIREQGAIPVDGVEPAGFSCEHASWLQSAEAAPRHRILFWFHQDLVRGLNCADGFMYVTADPEASEAAAWWQS
jgi:hypothetical protein